MTFNKEYETDPITVGKNDLLIAQQYLFPHQHKGLFGRDDEEQSDHIDYTESLFSMDTENRVIRLDSLSKVFSPGLRLGYVTAHPDLVSMFFQEVQTSLFQINGVVQAMMANLLSSWGVDGWDRHVRRIQRFLKSRRDTMDRQLKKHLDGLVEYQLPQSGLYFWIKLPDIQDSKQVALYDLYDQQILFGPGEFYSPKNGKQHLRSCFGAAIPHPYHFPFESITMTFNKDFGTDPITVDSKDLLVAQQYLFPHQYKGLVNQLYNLQCRTHNKSEDQIGKTWDICMVNGAQNGMNVILQCLLEEGGSVICEDPTYGGFIGICEGKGANVIRIEMDGQGILIDKLEDTLENWDHSKPRPKLLYLIPCGHNPCGHIMGEARKKEVLRVASKYDLLIIEDDPTYFIQFGRDDEEQSDHLEYAKSLFSMDTENRVIRLDSLSKIFSPGLRLGYITAHPDLVSMFFQEVQATMFQINGVVQAMMANLLSSWGVDGWDRHVRRIQRFLKSRRDTMDRLLKQHLDGLVEYTIPQSGLYFWIKLPDIQDSMLVAHSDLYDQHILFGPGEFYSPKNGKQHLRI
eukprot:gene13720-16174_t